MEHHLGVDAVLVALAAHVELVLVGVLVPLVVAQVVNVVLVLLSAHDHHLVALVEIRSAAVDQ